MVCCTMPVCWAVFVHGYVYLGKALSPEVSHSAGPPGAVGSRHPTFINRRPGDSSHLQSSAPMLSCISSRSRAVLQLLPSPAVLWIKDQVENYSPSNSSCALKVREFPHKTFAAVLSKTQDYITAHCGPKHRSQPCHMVSELYEQDGKTLSCFTALQSKALGTFKLPQLNCALADCSVSCLCVLSLQQDDLIQLHLPPLQTKQNFITSLQAQSALGRQDAGIC